MSKICDECETVAHCTKNGCIPKVSAKYAMRSALDALEARCGTNAEERGPTGAITLLNAALAEQPAPEDPSVAEPIYQHQDSNGKWTDQEKHSYDYNVKHGHATVRVVYLAPHPARQEPVPPSAYESLTRDMTTIAAREVPRGVPVAEFAMHALADAELREHDATPQPAQQEPMDEIRCSECGYLTKHTEHIGCLRNQLNAINAFEQRNFAIVNMDKFPQSAQCKPLTDDEFLDLILRTGSRELIGVSTCVGGSMRTPGHVMLLQRSAKIIKEFVEASYDIKENT